jgi:flagellin
MAQVINTNVAALFAGAALNSSAKALQTAQQQLSSGLRINSIADDPTGLGIAVGYQTNVLATNIAISQAGNGISQAQTNDGYGAQIVANLQRLYQIAVQGGGTATTAEATALVSENSRIAALSSADTAQVIDDRGTLASVKGTALTVVASTASAGILTDITTIMTARQNYGADIATYNSAISVLQVSSVNLSASYSRIMDTDYAAATTAMTRANILQQAGSAVLAQANQSPNSVLTLLR